MCRENASVLSVVSLGFAYEAMVSKAILHLPNTPYVLASLLLMQQIA